VFVCTHILTIWTQVFYLNQTMGQQWPLLSFFGIKTMKKTLFSIPLILMCSVSYSATINNHSSPQILLGYSYGYIMGRNNAEVLKDKNLDVFIQGLKQNSAEQKTNVENAEFLKDINLDLCTRQISQNPYPIRVLPS
jgi:hypothetical protein